MHFCLLIFLKSSFSKNSYRNTIRRSNSLDPDQARHFAGPDLGPNCLQWLSVDNTIYNVVGSEFFFESKITHQFKYMFWVLKRTVSLRRFF